MKKQLSLIIGLCIALLSASCDKSETEEDPQWRLDNEAQFAKIALDPEYTRINSESTAGYIMVKVIESGNGATPVFTDQVKVRYTGWYKNDWSKPDTYLNEQEKTVKNKIVFDSTENNNNIPNTFSVSGLIDGYRTALQRMREGDKWEIWIPWRIGYGASGSNSIPGYTTLVFEVELVGIVVTN